MSEDLQNRLNHLLQYSNSKIYTLFQKYAEKHFESIYCFQNTCHSCCLYRYLSKTNEFTPSHLLGDVLNAIKTDPRELMEVISSQLPQIVQVWFQEILLKPELSSQAMCTYYSKYPEKIQLFATVTFPTIYCHFVTDFFAQKGIDLITRIMHQSKASALTVQMSVALLLSRPDFAQKICEFFHEKENENRYIGNDTDYFGYLLEAIEEASPLLPKKVF